MDRFVRDLYVCLRTVEFSGDSFGFFGPLPADIFVGFVSNYYMTCLTRLLLKMSPSINSSELIMN